MASTAKRESTVDRRRQLFAEAAQLIDRDYADDLALDQVARRVASSRRQLQRAYSEIGRTTFRTHLTSVRMRRAAELLAARPLTVREVARHVGYRQPAQFAKAFRRHHGVSPTEHRTACGGPARIRVAA